MGWDSEQAERAWDGHDDRYERPSRRRQVAGIDYPAIPTAKRCQCGKDVWWHQVVAFRGVKKTYSGEKGPFSLEVGRTYGWRQYEHHGSPIYTPVLHVCDHEPGRFYCDRRSAQMGRDWGANDFWRDSRERCSCRPGRDHDGSEWGMCTYCEAVDEGHDEATIESMINDFDPREGQP
jgi:hypothetical protein